MQATKRNKEILKSVNIEKEYTLPEAISLLKDQSKVKFVESLDCAIRLGVDPRHADQMVRGTVSLPHGTGKTVRVLVIAKGAKIQEALDAGADHAGFEDYLEKIKGGWADVDVVVATPDSMAELGKLGKVLGPKGLMPNPKTETVGPNIKKIIEELKKGKITFKNDDTSNVHQMIGKISFSETQLKDNLVAFLDAIKKAKPGSAKGTYIQNLVLCSTMGPAIKINEN